MSRPVFRFLGRLQVLAQGQSAALAAIGIVGALQVWAFSTSGQLFAAWDILGVPKMPPPRLPFTDTISVTYSIECVRLGIDPYIDGRCDPWGRLFNYPPLWVGLEVFGISGKITELLGIAMAATVILALMFILRARSWTSFFIVLLTLLSPAVLYGIERGNVDTLLFSSLVFGLYLTRNLKPPGQQVLRGLLVIVLTALKAYPVGSCVMFMRPKARAAFTPVICLALLAFLAAAGSRVPSIFLNTPLTSYYSFGSAPLFLDLTKPLGLSPEHARWVGTTAALALLASIAGWTALAPRLELSKVFPRIKGGFVDELCLACLGIFCCCFVLGSNFSYRLIFLVGTLPKLMIVVDQRRSYLSLIAPFSVVGLLWATSLPSEAGHALNWVVYAGACAWLGFSISAPGRERL
jgi:hypothetical protein